MTDFLNPLGGRFIGPAGPVAPSGVTGTVPDPPRGLLQVDPGTIIKGVVIGRESDGLTSIATDKGTVRVASNAALPPGTHVTLEVRPTGDRLQVLILANDAIQSPTPTPGHAQTGQAGNIQTTTSGPAAPASGTGSNAAQPHATTSAPAPAVATPPPIRIVGSTMPAIVLQPQPSLPQPTLPQQPGAQQASPPTVTLPQPAVAPPGPVVQPALAAQVPAPPPQTPPPSAVLPNAPVQAAPAQAPIVTAPNPAATTPTQNAPQASAPQPLPPQAPAVQAQAVQTPVPLAQAPQAQPLQPQIPPPAQAAQPQPQPMPPSAPLPNTPQQATPAPSPVPQAPAPSLPATNVPAPNLPQVQGPAPQAPAPQSSAPQVSTPQVPQQQSPPPQPPQAQATQPAAPSTGTGQVASPVPSANTPPAPAPAQVSQAPQPAPPPQPSSPLAAQPTAPTIIANQTPTPAQQLPTPQPASPQPSPQASTPTTNTSQTPAPAPATNAPPPPPQPAPAQTSPPQTSPVPAPNPPAPLPSAANPPASLPAQSAPPGPPPPLPVGTATQPPPVPLGAQPPASVPPANVPPASVPPANVPAANVPPTIIPPMNVPVATVPTIVAPPSPALPQPVQIHLPNGQVITLAQPIPEALTAPLPAAGSQLLSTQPPPVPGVRMPISRPPMSTPPLSSALPQDVRQRILALFDEIPDPLATKSGQVAANALQVNVPAQQTASAANIAPAQTASALQPGAHLQIRVVAVQIGSQQPIEIDPAAHLVGGKDSQIVFGRVIAVTPAGHAVIHTPAGNILLQQKSSLPVGAQLALALDTIEPPAAAPVVAGPPPIQTPQQALLSLSQGWPTLADIVAILQGSAPAAARAGSVDAAVARQILAHLPQMGSKLGAGMMNAIAALRSGEIGRLMGPLFASRGLGGEREETVRRLRGEFAQLSSLAQEKPEIEWRALFLPYLDDQNRVQRINLFYRRPRGGEAGDDEKNGTRFVVEADFTRLGPFQLDGLMRQQRFDLMVRSRIRLDERMRRDIEAIYEEARGLTGFAGSIAFQTVDAFPVMPLEELKQSGERV